MLIILKDMDEEMCRKIFRAYIDLNQIIHIKICFPFWRNRSVREGRLEVNKDGTKNVKAKLLGEVISYEFAHNEREKEEGVTITTLKVLNETDNVESNKFFEINKDGSMKIHSKKLHKKHIRCEKFLS